MFGNKIKKINRNKQIFKRKKVLQKYTMPKEEHFCVCENQQEKPDANHRTLTMRIISI